MIYNPKFHWWLMISSPFFNLASLWRREGIEGCSRAPGPTHPNRRRHNLDFSSRDMVLPVTQALKPLVEQTVSLRSKKTSFKVKWYFFGKKKINGNIELSLTGRRRMSDFFSTVGTSSIVRSDFNLWTSHSSDPSHNVSTSGWRTFGSSTVGHRYE